MVCRACFLPLWPGKFPRTSCFAEKTKKRVQNTPDGREWVRMGASGCMDTEGSKNKAKRDANSREGHVFGCMVNVKKCVMLATMIMVSGEDHLDQ